MKKKALYIIGGIVTFLLITNPSPKSFEEYSKVVGNNGHSTKTTRKYNFFVASIYQARHEDYYISSETYYSSYDRYYFGIAGNFFALKN
jgi:hypothetical protein